MSDIVERLRELANLKTGDPPPSWLPDNNWGSPLCELARQAVDLIDGLRIIAGKAHVGPSFAEIAKDLPRREPPGPS